MISKQPGITVTAQPHLRTSLRSPRVFTPPQTKPRLAFQNLERLLRPNEKSFLISSNNSAAIIAPVHPDFTQLNGAGSASVPIWSSSSTHACTHTPGEPPLIGAKSSIVSLAYLLLPHSARLSTTPALTSLATFSQSFQPDVSGSPVVPPPWCGQRRLRDQS